MHQFDLTHGARVGRNSSAVGVQTLDEACVGQQVAARRPLLVSD